MTRETREYTVVSFDELTKEQQGQVIDTYRWINVGDDSYWEDTTVADAESIGLLAVISDGKITKLSTKVGHTEVQVAYAILENHGATTDSYRLAEDYIGGKISEAYFMVMLKKAYSKLLIE